MDDLVWNLTSPQVILKNSPHFCMVWALPKHPEQFKSGFTRLIVCSLYYKRIDSFPIVSGLWQPPTYGVYHVVARKVHPCELLAAFGVVTILQLTHLSVKTMGTETAPNDFCGIHSFTRVEI